MTEKELEISNRPYDTLAAMAIGFGAMTLGGFGWIILGIFTRVYGMCSGASEQWTTIYLRLLFLPPMIGISAGLFANRRYTIARVKNPTHVNSKCRENHS